jgi:pseudaminic acid synthase
MTEKMFIDSTEIGNGAPPYVIAELSANHNGNIERALELIEAAKVAGANAVKLQTYTADTITLKSDTDDFIIRGGLWNGRTLYDLYEEAHMPWDWHKPLFERARAIGLSIFSTPFDRTAVDFLEDLNVPAYKIASFEAVDLPLIRYVASTKKPMIISTGMANEEEIAAAIQAARDSGCQQIAILRCVSGYPAPAGDYNLATIPDMRLKFGVTVGLSDHTIDNTTAIASVALGASIIEKHFTMDRNGGGPDDSFSLEPNELRDLCAGASTAWRALGRVHYGQKASEISNVNYRRSLYFVREMTRGEIITPASIRSVRPGRGLPPNTYDALIGKRVSCDIQPATAVHWKHIEI